MQDNNKIIDKIRKVLALTSSPNEGEAASAAARVQEMLAKYNLQLGDVIEKKADEAIQIYKGMRTPSRPWCRQIAVATASLYFCRYYYTFVKEGAARKCGYIRYDEHYFVGRPHNAAVAMMMFEYLTKTVERLAVAGSKSVPATERTSYMTSFRTACALRLNARIYARLTETIKSATRSTEVNGSGGAPSSNLPALASLYQQAKQELQEFMDENFSKNSIKEKVTKVVYNHSKGTQDGDKAGSSIGLDQQVGAGGKPSALIGRT